MSKNFIFTSESVCAGHPDKVCDSISDAILDEVLKQDKYGRVAVECLAGFNKLIIAGEVKTSAKIDYQQVARERINALGYTLPLLNFSDESEIQVYIHEQSPEISVGVSRNGAGDQGMMFGFACNQTKSLMPLPISIAHRLAEQIDHIRENKLKYLRPDGKTQVTVEYKNREAFRINQVVIAVPHDEKIKLSQVKNEVFKYIVAPILDEFGFSLKSKDLILNGTGVWHLSGPAQDCGLTGRKIIVDGYGGYARVGGGAFSGKDPTKVDRSGAYAARYLAKNIVAEKLAEQAEVRIAYFIGAKKPIMLEVETFGTNKTKNGNIKDYMNKILDTSVEGIIKELNLRNPIYLQTSAYGHFGRPQFPWEKVI